MKLKFALTLVATTLLSAVSFANGPTILLDKENSHEAASTTDINMHADNSTSYKFPDDGSPPTFVSDREDGCFLVFQRADGGPSEELTIGKGAIFTPEQAVGLSGSSALFSVARIDGKGGTKKIGRAQFRCDKTEMPFEEMSLKMKKIGIPAELKTSNKQKQDVEKQLNRGTASIPSGHSK